MVENIEPKKLILFDLVSTITDAGPRYAEAYVRIAEAYNLPIPEKNDILDELGQRNLKDIIRIHSPDLPAEKVQNFMNDCNGACDSMLYDVHWIEVLFKDVREALQTLNSNGYAIGLFTGTREDAMVAQLRYHNIAQYFDADLLRAKDNIRDAAKDTQTLKNDHIESIIQTFAKKMDQDESVTRRNTIVVGDTLSDYEAAKASRTAFVGFAETEDKVQKFVSGGVRAIFSAYKDAPALLSSLLSPEMPVPHKNIRSGPQQ